MSERKKSKKQSKTGNDKPTVGLLMGLLNETSWASIWSGVADLARERDVNLICFTGGMLEDTVGFQEQANVLYDLVDVEQLDGLIIWGGIGKFVDAPTLETFYKRYQSIPTVSIGDSVADVPSVLADNYGGMYQVVTHLVEDHGYRRIAYIKGHENFQEHEERYRAYCDALKEYGLAFDQDLVVTESDTGKPHYNREIGKQAIEILLDERQAKFEALIVNDDVFAYGVIEELQSRGMHIPDDLPIVGFNDDSESQYITPSLTTVPYPYYELGRQAAEMLLTQLAGNNILDRMFVPTRLGVRQSCSCLDPAVEQISGSTMPALMKTFSPEAQQSAGKKIFDILAEHREDILSEVEQTIELSLTGYEGEIINPDWFEQLLDAFGAELSGTPGIFLRELDTIMRQIIAVGGDVMVWQNAISGLRRQVVIYLDEEEILLRRAEDLWQQARVMISDFVKRVEGYKTLQVERQAQRVNTLGRELINTADIPAMMDVLAQNLPGLGIDRCYLSLYQNPEQPLGESRLLLAYDKRGRRKVKEADIVFPSDQLAPKKMFHSKKSYSLVVEPLYFREDQQGFVLFESENLPGELFHTLREQISSALQSALLIEKRKVAEEESRESRRFLEDILNGLDDPIFVKDEQHKWVLMSDTMCDFMGYPKEELIGKTDYDFFPKEQADIFWEHDDHVFSTEEVDLNEEEFTSADGIVHTISTKKSVFRDATTGQRILVGAIRDITERKQSEDIIAKRAAELEIVAQVSTAALNILDTTELLQTVVDLTKESFGLYHAHIYLLDDITNDLVLTAGAGDVGRKMVAEGWSIPIDREQSLVARAARTQTGVIVNNVREEPGWLPNEDLPQTHAELAVPLLVGNRVLGILDVQSVETDHFTNDDVRIQTTLAAQVAVALENARLFEQAERTDFLLRERVKELDCLNDIGREMEDNPPPLPELLEWITRRIPSAMQFPELTVVAIKFDGQVYGKPEAIELPKQIVHGLYIGGEILGRIYISYTEKYDFIDEESALLGGIATRVSGFIENRRLLEQVNQRASELEDATSFLNSVLQNIPSGLFVKEAKDLKFVHWNKANEELHGLMEKDLLGKTDYDFFNKKEADFFVKKDREVLASGQLLDIPEEPLHTPHRGLRYLHTTKVPILGPDGEPRYLLGISEDITERKEAEQQMAQQSEFLSTVMDNMPIGIFAKDVKDDYRFSIWNPKVEEIFGSEFAEMINKSDYDFFPKEEADYYRQTDEAVMAGKEIIDIPVEEVTTKNGTILAHTIKVPIYDSDGHPATLLGLLDDITEQKQAETEREQLLVDVQRLAAIVENHPDFIGVGTLEGNPLYLNPAGLKMMGLPLDHDVTTMDAGDFFTTEDAAKLMQEGIPAALEQGFWSTEANLLRADGKILPVEETISIQYDTDGNPTSFSITMHDITNRQVAATEQARLLAEVEASYRQYVQQEWEQYLQEQHQGQWYVEHKQVESAVSSDLARLQEEVMREHATKAISHRPGNGADFPTADTQAEPAAIVSPISLRGQVIGTLNLQDVASDRNWSSEEIALVEAVSEQLALTVENLRLFDDTQRRATREQVTRQITDKMHAAPDVDAIIQTGLTELAKTLGVSRTYVKLNPEVEANQSTEPVIPVQENLALDVDEEANN